MIIVIYAGYQSIPLDPNLLKTTGVGGTEQCIIHLAKQFAKEHTVYVTGSVTNIESESVTYCDLESFKNKIGETKIDWVIGVSYINYLLELDFLNFDKSFFWIHNTDFYPWHRGEELENGGDYLLNDTRLSYVVCLTEWHKNNFISQYPLIANKVIVIGNGIESNKFQTTKKINDSFIYTSHAERGLDKVLEDWPNIKK